MYNEPPPNFLYSAYLLKAKFVHTDGTPKEISGTGFVLAIKNNLSVIVTNRHVIDINYRRADLKYKDFSLQGLSITGRRADDTTYTFTLHHEAKAFFSNHIENDVVLIEPRVYENEPEQLAKGLHWHFVIEHLATQEVFDTVLHPYDDVAFSGFPDQHDKLAQRPILRSGKIASDPKFDYSWTGNFEGNCVAYEGFSSEGASGSPVFAPLRGIPEIAGARNGYLVGINAGHISDHNRFATHSGISYFYKSTVILDIIQSEGLA